MAQLLQAAKKETSTAIRHNVMLEAADTLSQNGAVEE